MLLPETHPDNQPNEHPHRQGNADVLRENGANGGSEAHPQAHPHGLIAVFLFLLLFLFCPSGEEHRQSDPGTTSGTAAIIKSRINFHSFFF